MSAMTTSPREVKFPEQYTLATMSRVCSALTSIPDGSTVTIDFGRSNSISPRAMLYIYPALKYLNNPSRNLKIKTANIESNRYAKHIGFFDISGIEENSLRQEGATTANYLPIQEIPTLSWLSDLCFIGLSEHIDRKCKLLSEVLCQGMSETEKSFLHYNLREIVRNVFEHSSADSISYVAQCWPKLRKAEIAISDTGIGLRATTSRNKIKKVVTDSDAIDVAVLPGFTGSTRLSFGEPWDNTGYGLFMTSEIAKRLGRFTIVSGTAGREMSDGKAREIRTCVTGTFISIELSWDESTSSEEYIANLAEQGQRISKQHFDGKIQEASLSSRGSR